LIRVNHRLCRWTPKSLTFAGVVIPAVPAALLSRDQEPESRVLKHAKTVRLLPLAI
jgi:hypothetical protein